MTRGVRNRPDLERRTPAPHIPAPVSGGPRPGEICVLGSALWWYAKSGEWRVVPEELWRRDGDEIAWRRPEEPLPCNPLVWDVVFAPSRARGAVVAVRVVRVTQSEGSGAPFDVVVRGVTPEGDEVELRRGAREFFVDGVEAALELAIPPRLDGVVEFEPRR